MKTVSMRNWKSLVAVLIILVVVIVLLWQVFIGVTTGLWDVPLLTVLAFALWIAIYVMLSAHEESA